VSENFFSIVMVGYNSKEWINKAVESVLAQNYKNFEIVAVDAMTDDGTYEALQEYEHLDNFKLFRSPKRSFQVENTLFGVKHSKPNSIVVTLDFDDWLPDADTLTRLDEVYTEDVWMSYGTYCEYHGDDRYRVFEKGFFHRYPDEIVESNDFRSYRWLASHLRTFRRELFLSIDDNDLRDTDGEYYSMAGDFAFMFPMLEMAGDRFEYIPNVMYVYNRTNVLAEDKVDHLQTEQRGVVRQEQTADRVRQSKRYSKLNSLPYPLEELSQ